MTVVAYVALGANLANPNITLVEAMDVISKISGIEVTLRSSLYTSPPMDSYGPDYLNAAIEITTSHSAMVTLAYLQQIEQEFGRIRTHRNAPRTLDLDLLHYNKETHHTTHLIIPHPRMYERAFVLLPLHEIAPHLVTAEQLLRVKDQEIHRLPKTRKPCI